MRLQKLTATLALAAAVVSTVSLSAPARATEPAIADPNPGVMAPQGSLDPKSLNLKPAYQLPSALLFFRAELTSQLFVYTPGQYDPIGHLYVAPGYRHLWCYVKNHGLKHSGLFNTRIRIYRYWPFPFVQTITLNLPMSLPAGAYSLRGFRVAAPWGLKQVTSFADSGLIVPEYNEANNFDSIP
jgi:hypothetical protein